MQCRASESTSRWTRKAKSKSDCVISIDADLQDDVSVIRSFLLKYHEGG